MEKITWKFEKKKIADLIPAKYNPRVLSDKQKADLKESVETFNQVEPLVLNLDNKVIGGHSRLKIFADLGFVECDAMIPNRQLTPKEEKELNIRLNKNTGEFDYKLLKEYFNFDDLVGWGFEDSELKMWFGLGGADDMEVDEERMQIIMVQPPETLKLKERAALRFGNKGEYDMVKKWILDGNGDQAVKALISLAK